MKIKKIMMKIKKISITILIFIIIAATFAYVYNRIPHHYTDAETQIELNPEFADIPIESCDFYQKNDVIFLGGVLEFYSYGKINVSEEYYEKLLETYSFSERSGILDYQAMNSKKLSGEFEDVITNQTYLISEEFQSEFYSFVCLSAKENAIYFYFYTY